MLLLLFHCLSHSNIVQWQMTDMNTEQPVAEFETNWDEP